MESVYKLSKYSQKISEACRSKQLDKVMEYNKHELAHINKLSKYFGNQKGGAEVQEVVGAVQELVKAVVADRDASISTLQQLVQEKSSVIEQIDDEVEGRVISLFKEEGEARSAPTPAVVLQKVQRLKEERDTLTKANETLQGEKKAVQDSASRESGLLAGIRVTLEAKEKELAQAKQDLDQARSQTSALQQSLDKVAQEASASTQEVTAQNKQLQAKVLQLEQANKSKEQELSRTQAEAKLISETNDKTQVRIRELEKATAEAEVQFQQINRKTTSAMLQLEGELKAKNEELAEVQAKLKAKDTRIAELEQAVADTKRMMKEGEDKLKASLGELQSRK